MKTSSISTPYEPPVSLPVPRVTTYLPSTISWTEFLLSSLRYILFGFMIAIIGMGVVLTLALAVYELNEQGYILDFLTWIEDIGYWGYVVMIACLILVNVPFMIGYGSMMIASGFIFKFIGGLITVIIGCQIGSVVVALLIRIPYFKLKAKKYIASKLYLQALMEELRQHKIKFAFLLRMSPVPLGLQNLVLALSGIPLWLYIPTTFFGLLVEQIPVVYIGSTINQISEVISGERPFDWKQGLVLAISSVAIVLLTIFLLIITNRAFKKVKLRELEMLNSSNTTTTTTSSETELDEIITPSEHIIILPTTTTDKHDDDDDNNNSSSISRSGDRTIVKTTTNTSDHSFPLKSNTSADSSVSKRTKFNDHVVDEEEEEEEENVVSLNLDEHMKIPSVDSSLHRNDEVMIGNTESYEDDDDIINQRVVWDEAENNNNNYYSEREESYSDYHKRNAQVDDDML